MSPEPRTTEQVLADEEAARAAAVEAGDAVEMRAIGAPTHVPPGADVERAAERSVYRDTNGRRRIVGAGSPVPAGWTFEETADLGDRIGAGDPPTAPEDAGPAATGGGNARRPARKKS